MCDIEQNLQVNPNSLFLLPCTSQRKNIFSQTGKRGRFTANK